MRRNIFHDKINIAYGNRKIELSNDIFRRNLNYFKLKNCWLNSKLCVKHKYKGTKFPTESNFVAPSQILMFRF